MQVSEEDFCEGGALAHLQMELQLWAAYRGQLLARTVRGECAAYCNRKHIMYVATSMTTLLVSHGTSSMMMRSVADRVIVTGWVDLCFSHSSHLQTIISTALSYCAQAG